MGKIRLIDRIRLYYSFLEIFQSNKSDDEINELLGYFYMDENNRLVLDGNLETLTRFFDKFSDGMPGRAELGLSREEYQKERVLIAHENYLRVIESKFNEIRSKKEYLN